MRFPRKKAGVDAPQPGKYKSRVTYVNGRRFSSKREARDYERLLALQAAGKIFHLRTQVRFPLVVNGVKVCTYVADFTYIEGGRLVVADSKGFRTDVYKLKSKLLKACRNIDILEM